jgi:hypothetical protein
MAWISRENLPYKSITISIPGLNSSVRLGARTTKASPFKSNLTTLLQFRSVQHEIISWIPDHAALVGYTKLRSLGTTSLSTYLLIRLPWSFKPCVHSPFQSLSQNTRQKLHVNVTYIISVSDRNELNNIMLIETTVLHFVCLVCLVCLPF